MFYGQYVMYACSKRAGRRGRITTGSCLHNMSALGQQLICTSEWSGNIPRQ